MRSSSKLWLIVSLVSGIATLLLLGGFVYAVHDIVNPASAPGFSSDIGKGTQEPAELPPTGQIGMVVIGDSLAKGTGDDEGKGFGERAVELLQSKAADRDVKLLGNLGINGLLTSGLTDELQEDGVQHVLKEASVILLSIGGNDLFQGAEALESGGDLPTAAELNTSIDQASERLKTIVAQLKQINPAATLVYIGLYNPFSDIEEMRTVGNNGVVRWNTAAQQTLNQYNGTLMIPTYDLFAGNLSAYLSGDHFHPNSDGYEQIAQRIVQSLK
ncbi:GDSL-type esterase/lipase family protein [Paenibacillus physcomitrellae]|uniref:Lipase/acylhydrolase n=1 Tax=Paenibacillus physcomitrellae TaxID=1619311 RepID=A0ABQ1FPI5_9BACL|nr:GDSL-type esterase/lipase family protein [Paenibacillus physcomitrellae]GGA23850.1 lipase/acylhydrolase [Paenibacillus physcomitrellae]